MNFTVTSEAIATDPMVRSGVPTLRNTRYPVAMVFANLVSNGGKMSLKEVVEDAEINAEDVLQLFRDIGNCLNESHSSLSYEAERALMRPHNFDKLPPEEQWEIDKELGILDWDGK